MASYWEPSRNTAQHEIKFLSMMEERGVSKTSV